ncbi:hypothetical protein GCM10017083_13490 [Thalassobaculum fulvum]|uniref:Uncharacterized protein n=1 Tax=Thalassobaculum fulvum TaxID=1633335 RepID=A0A918XQ10_9PROT|nr:hypothetical protein [Thalassobaculum fulvum]GHD45485.1 hypothetical protein GCM10017083_13490 [Thalassobaculum fulvum]
MASDLATTELEGGLDSAALAAARLRTVLAFALTLLAILVLGAAIWLQVAARFDTARIRTEAETVRNAMSGMLAMGLPLKDFIGFPAVSARVFHANPGVRAIVVRDLGGRPVLSTIDAGVAGSAPAFGATISADDVVVDRIGELSRVALPVVNRFGPVGTVELVFARDPVGDLTRNAALAGLAATTLLTIGLIVHGLAIANPEFFASRRDLLGAYATVAALGLALTASTLAGLAAEKAAETAGAYASSLGARLGEAVAVGISPEDLSGLDDVVQEYRASNRIIGYVALLEGNRIAAATGLTPGLRRWQRPRGYFDAIYEVRPRRLYTPQYRVAVGIPWRVAFRELIDAAVVPSAIALALLLVGATLVARIRLQERA